MAIINDLLVGLKIRDKPLEDDWLNLYVDDCKTKRDYKTMT